MNQLKLFGKRLQTIRKAARVTQEETAEKAHLNPKYLGQIERGEKRQSFDASLALAEALGAPFTVVKDGGHIIAEAGYTQFSQLLDDLKGLRLI